MSRSILLAEIMHETNTFNRIATTRRDFETRYWLEGDHFRGAFDRIVFAIPYTGRRGRRNNEGFRRTFGVLG